MCLPYFEIDEAEFEYLLLLLDSKCFCIPILDLLICTVCPTKRITGVSYLALMF